MWCLPWHPGVWLNWKSRQFFGPWVKRQLPTFRATVRAAAHIISYRFAPWEYAHSLKYNSILMYLSASSPLVWAAFWGERGEIRKNIFPRHSVLFILWVFGFLHCQKRKGNNRKHDTIHQPASRPNYIHYTGKVLVFCFEWFRFVCCTQNDQ